jgi:hypothetical protein
MPYLVEDWAWVVEADDYPTPFTLVVTSFAHGWLVLWRVLAISPLPSIVPLTWFLEALPQVFAEARARGCVGFLTLLSEDRPEEAKLARIVVSATGGQVMPEKLMMCVGPLVERGASAREEQFK